MDEEDYFGNFLNANKFKQRHDDLQLREVIDPDDWKKSLVAIVNAGYFPSTNSFQFPAAILQGNIPSHFINKTKKIFQS